DRAQPWAGGRVEGRVEMIKDRPPSANPIQILIRCTAAWIDIAPQLVGRAGLGLASAYELRARARPIWLDEMIFEERTEVEPLDGSVNWRRFAFELPAFVPRALEGTMCAFRYVVEATRPRPVGR